MNTDRRSSKEDLAPFCMDIDIRHKMSLLEREKAMTETMEWLKTQLVRYMKMVNFQLVSFLNDNASKTFVEKNANEELFEDMMYCYMVVQSSIKRYGLSVFL